MSHIDARTPPTFSNGTASTDGAGAANTTSDPDPFSVLDEIAAKDISSRANYVYSFFAALALAAGAFLLYSLVQTYRAHRRLGWLDCLLWTFCGVQLLLLLLSLHVVAYRPDYLWTTALGCAALSFVINAVSLGGLLVLVLMAYVLTLDPPSHALLRKPWPSAALVVLTSILVSLMLAAIRGPDEGLDVTADCVMDPVGAGVRYAASKVCLAFLVPYLLQLGLLICGLVRQWRTRGRFLSGLEEGPVFLALSVVTFLCLLFYSVALIRGAELQRREEAGLSFHERAFLNVAELVLFSASGAALLLVLFLHRPCRESLRGALRQLRDCCRRPGRSQRSRNISGPHIEITDTLQDIEY